MYCQNCGTQLPQGAKFCSNCGAMQMMQENPQQPQQIPYTTPVTPTHQKSQVPYTMPIEPSAQYHQPWQTAQNNGHTIPLEKNQNNQPWEDVKWGQEPALETLQTNKNDHAQLYTAPIHPDPQPEEKKEPPKQKKRIRKLPILLGAIAVLLAAVLITGNKEENPKPKVQTPEATEEKQEPLGPVRIENGEFTFDAETYADYFAWDGEGTRNGPNIIFAEGKEYKNDDGSVSHMYELINGNDTGLKSWGRTYILSAPGKKNVVRIMLLMDETVMEDQQRLAEFITAAVQQCHGAMTDEMLEAFYATETREERNYKDNTPYVNYQYMEYGLNLEVADFGTSVSILLCPAEQIKNDRKFDSTGFLFDAETFADAYGRDLSANGVPYRDSGSVGHNEDGTETYLWLADEAGEDVVQIQIISNPDTGKIIKIYASSITEKQTVPTQEQIMACLTLIQTCHGAVTDAQWQEIIDKMPTSETEMTTTYDVDLDGMDVWIALGNGNNSIIVGCSIGE